ncbi:THUMP domain-containing protein [Sorangium sp. So ce1504]|uniref:THUMP domain-containing class I SAM-dependent RNA methyltransferase n=1 Tax=Sorangium sp. So ce1504 TaxID=3133337 RepID=UPI003F5D64F3
MDFFATAAKGTEPALRDELREHRFRGVRADRGGVHFSGPPDDGFRACIELRTAVRVLVELASFDAPSGDALYEGVSRVDWAPYLSPVHTLAVRASCRSSALTHTQFIAQRTKDAIVDQIRRRVGARPSVDLDDPDLALFLHLVRDRATLYADLGGAALHRRGYRTHIGGAPLKETLAAALLRLSGWDRARPFVDPMCGAGTIALEAALWARDIAPGLRAQRFGFERWACHDQAAARRTTELRDAARARIRPEGPAIVAADIDPRAAEITRGNARMAGVQIEVRCQSITALAPTAPPGHVLTNPPYGERLPGTLALYRDMAAALSRLEGHRVAILAGTEDIEHAMRRRPERSLTVFNGPIECRLLTYDIP